MIEWISCDEESPPFDTSILVCDCYNEFVSFGKFICDDPQLPEEEQTGFFELMNIESIEIDSVITHWMPKPEPARIYD